MVAEEIVAVAVAVAEAVAVASMTEAVAPTEYPN
tara:strand:- start:243 stop:344 length:102 start_codon:yes stop_codon:yes gene_type:complete